MEKAAEQPSATIDTRKVSDSHGVTMQRIEAQSGMRENLPMKTSKARVHESEAVLTLAGDSSHEKGGTQELQAECEIHSPSQRRTRTV